MYFTSRMSYVQKMTVKILKNVIATSTLVHMSSNRKSSNNHTVCKTSKLSFEVFNNQVTTKVYFKRNGFLFPINCISYLDSNIPYIILTAPQALKHLGLPEQCIRQTNMINLVNSLILVTKSQVNRQKKLLAVLKDIWQTF